MHGVRNNAFLRSASACMANDMTAHKAEWTLLKLMHSCGQLPSARRRGEYTLVDSLYLCGQHCARTHIKRYSVKNNAVLWIASVCTASRMKHFCRDVHFIRWGNNYSSQCHEKFHASVYSYADCWCITDESYASQRCDDTSASQCIKCCTSEWRATENPERTGTRWWWSSGIRHQGPNFFSEKDER